MSAHTAAGEVPGGTTWLPRPLAPEVDDFDLDLRLGELDAWYGGQPGIPLYDAQSDGNCLPTGGQGAGGTCNTQNNTCPATCAGLGTCPHTQCGPTCQATCAGLNTCPRTQCRTCAATCGDKATCPRTDCGACGPTFAQTHCPSCRGPVCHEP
jgi:hypothetical protein